MKFRIVTSCLLLLAVGSVARADLVRREFVHTDGGTQLVRQTAPGEDTVLPRETRDEVLWQRTIPGNIYSSCAAMGLEVFAGTNNGTTCVAEYFAEGSGGDPTWIYTGDENQARARGGLLAIVEVVDEIQGVRVHVYEAGASPAELWRADFTNASAPARCLRLSADGSVLALAVNKTDNCVVSFHAAATGDVLSSFSAPSGQYARNLVLTADGSEAALRAGATLHVLDVATGTSFWTANLGASADPLAFSPDGHWLASGWSSMTLWERDGDIYRSRWTNDGGSGWYLGTCAVSDSGQLVTGWYSLSYDRNRIHWFDTGSDTPVWTFEFPQSGGDYQDLPVASATDGQIAVIGSWGDEVDQNPEIVVFAADDPHPAFTVNTAGSIYDVDLDPATGRVTACGKHVHANEFGSGGDLYVLELDTGTAAPETPAAAVALSAYPNPFNPQTTVTFRTASPGPVAITVLDVTGRRIAELTDRTYAAGVHELTWDGRDAGGRAVPAGTYLLRLENADQVATRKLSLVR